jgi:hypothetical protein
MKKLIIKESTNNDRETIIKNLKSIQSFGCVSDEYKIVEHPKNGKIGLYLKTKTTNKWLFVYDDLTAEVSDPVTGIVEKSVKITCDEYTNQKKSDVDVKDPKTNELLVKLGFNPKDKYLKEKIGAVLTKVNEQNNTLQTIIDQGALSEELIDFNDILKVYYPNDDKNRLKIPSLDNRGVVKGYEEITDKNKSQLLPLTYKDRLTNDYNKRDLSVYGIIGTYYIPKGGVDNVESTPMKTESSDCLNILINYLTQALQNKSFGSIADVEGKKMREYKDRTITKIQNCYNTGSYDNFVNMNPEEIANVTKNKIPTNLINRTLSFKEIIKLINGEKVAGITIDPMWQSQIILESNKPNEVIKESVIRKHIAEAIKNKQKDVMVESILRDIKGLKK